MTRLRQYLAQRKITREKQKEAARNKRISEILISMPDELWARLGENPEAARNYLRKEINS